MQDIQEIFKRINETKMERKKVADIRKETRANSKPYQDAVEEYEAARAKKKEIESALDVELSSELEQLERFKQSLESDQEMLSDIVLTKLMKGETVELMDENETAYEPVFSVRFKKTG